MSWLFRIGFVASSIALAAILAPIAEAAEDQVGVDAILKALTPSSATSKSLTAPATPSDEEREFMKSLATKAITVEARQQVAEIITNHELPEIDLTVEFAFGSDELSQTAKSTLRKLGEVISSSNLVGSTFLIAGHTDAVGAAEYNQDLSERRASAAKDYLVSNYRIPADQLVAIGFGEEQLKNAQLPDAAENRRVQVVNVGG